MRSRGFAMWVLGLVLLATAACTAARPPTPTPPPASDGGAAEATQPSTPTHTATLPPTATQEPTPTPEPTRTPDFTATEQAQQAAATATAQAQIIEARQAEKEHIAAIQQIFTHFHEMYPNGYPGGMDVSFHAVGGKGGFAKSLWNLVRNIDELFQSLSSQGTPEASTPTPPDSLVERITSLLKTNPDGRLVIVYKGRNVDYCPDTGNMTTCRLYGGPASVAAVYKYREGFWDPFIVDIRGLDQGGDFLLENGASWAPWDLTAGTLPTDKKLRNQRPAYWEEQIYWFDGENLIHLGGIAGDGTKKEFTDTDKDRTHISGKIRFLPPEEINKETAQQILDIIKNAGQER